MNGHIILTNEFVLDNDEAYSVLKSKLGDPVVYGKISLEEKTLIMKICLKTLIFTDLDTKNVVECFKDIMTFNDLKEHLNLGEYSTKAIAQFLKFPLSRRLLINNDELLIEVIRKLKKQLEMIQRL